ncbi:hypothetical protein CERZMDRAFT_81010 [Cercospora zeae-maydis SCOH1-5]|uniref:Uncharacterized protein n=1 Tax=Cercospora zeae-maydis SCOH1-5 TaxID=717836 RepID=A0A6A6FUC4_9PEZI|nr:hypothetical protein CERZMDRAFT_81010 [Cercospora zeae-maydis SCOH1-5]
MAPEHTGSEEQLRVILLLFTQWKFEKNKKLAHQIFRLIYPDWQGNQTALWSEFHGRSDEGANPLWYDIDRPNKERQEPFTTEEIKTNYELFEKIKSSVDENTKKMLDLLENWGSPHYLDGDCWRQATADRFRREREAREQGTDSGVGVQAGPSKLHAGEKELDMDGEKEKDVQEQRKGDEREKDQSMELDAKTTRRNRKPKESVKPSSLASAEWQQRLIERRDREEAVEDMKAKLQEMQTGRSLRSAGMKVKMLKDDIAKDSTKEAGEEEASDDNGDGERFVQPAKATKPTRKYGASIKDTKNPAKKPQAPSKNPFEEPSDDGKKEDEGEIEQPLPSIANTKRRYRTKAFNAPIQPPIQTRARKAEIAKDDEDGEEEHDDKKQKMWRPSRKTRAVKLSGSLAAQLAAANQNKSTKAAESKDEESAEDDGDVIPQTPAKPSAVPRASWFTTAPPLSAAFFSRQTTGEQAAKLSAKENEEEDDDDVPPTPADPPARQRASRFRASKSTRVIAPRQTRSQAAMNQKAQPTIEEEGSDFEETPPLAARGALPFPVESASEAEE